MYVYLILSNIGNKPLFQWRRRICQLRCPALRKDLSQSKDKERYIPDTSELRSERLYFRIERLCGCISGTIIKVVKYRLIVVHERLQNSVKALQLHLVYSIIPPCQFSDQRRSIVYSQVIYLHQFKVSVIALLDVRI